MRAKIIIKKKKKDLNYFSLCALDLFNTQVSQFELNYVNKLTFPQHSNLLRCTCIFIETDIRCYSLCELIQIVCSNFKNTPIGEVKTGFF